MLLIGCTTVILLLLLLLLPTYDVTVCI